MKCFQSPFFLAGCSKSYSTLSKKSYILKRSVSYIVLEMEVKDISSEIEMIRRKLGELEERIRKIDRLDKLEARVKALEDKLQKKL
jgi:hypothetical protein